MFLMWFLKSETELLAQNNVFVRKQTFFYFIRVHAEKPPLYKLYICAAFKIWHEHQRLASSNY